jgi:hypothetical protein
MVNTITQESGVFQNSRAAYLLAGYRLGTVTPYAGISRWLSTRKTFSTSPLPSVPTFDRIMASSSVNQTTYTLGARWDVQSNIALKAQWDGIRGTSSSTFPFQNSATGWSGRTNVLSLIMDFVF